MEGYYNFHKREKNVEKLFSGSKSSHGPWKRLFFFMRSADSRFLLNHQTEWNDYSPPKSKDRFVPSDRITRIAKDLVKELDLPLDIMAITSPELLFFAEV